MSWFLSTPNTSAPPDVAPERLLDAIVQASDDVIVTLDRDGNITGWGPGGERSFGYPPAEVVGAPFANLFAEHLRGHLAAAFDDVRAGERVRHFETEIVRKDGMPVAVSLAWWPLVDATDPVVPSVVIARDITEQLVAQAALAEVEARVRASEALAHVGSWLWDLRTGAVQWSEEFHRIHGVDPLDFDGTFECHLGTIDAADRERVRRGMERAVVAGRPFDEEYRVVRPDGTIRWIHARAQPALGSAGAAIGLRGIGQDVTERVIPS